MSVPVPRRVRAHFTLFPVVAWLFPLVVRVSVPVRLSKLVFTLLVRRTRRMSLVLVRINGIMISRRLFRAIRGILVIFLLRRSTMRILRGLLIGLRMQVLAWALMVVILLTSVMLMVHRIVMFFLLVNILVVSGVLFLFLFGGWVMVTSLLLGGW